MELAIKDTGKMLTVSQANFGCDFNQALVHQVVVACLAALRQGTSAQKSRADVSGSTKKPWRQKGTGRARAGSVKSPLWRSGGVTFAAKPRSYQQKVNKKMYRGALKSILSELVRQDRLLIVPSFTLEQPKTKILVKKLKEMSLDNILMVFNEIDKNVSLAARNLINVDTIKVTDINPINLMKFDKVMMTVDSVPKLEERLHDN